ncbi:polyphenol oxidase family protein [Helicobacter trogontum]|uniref:polyphenol oxidase family protein n=1 Tax=Helicobacter trogontum TaxID=50960 RepID=UPI002A91042F|nr:polyphenol oxidase family protein [Helicobacter trogontum]MDY5185724.1 polyphenol oxidase family protein [Helicobacter trogontum]
MKYIQKDFFTSKDSKLFCSTKLHFVLTNRYHGVSKPPYNSLNLAYHVNDKLESARINRSYIMQKYYKNKTLLYLNQIHSNTIFAIQENKGILEASQHNFKGNITTATKHSILMQDGSQYNEILVGDGDGIICNKSDFVLMSMVADCNPILIYAKPQNVFAVLHAGRQGVCSKILTHALMLFIHDYNVKMQDICIFIGTSIRKCCYEIDNNLAFQLMQEFGEKYIACENERYKLDMIGLLCDEILSFGIELSQVEISPSCSCCDESYFSYRREKITGRFALFASLCDEV